MLNGAAIFTELINKGGMLRPPPRDIIHSGSDNPECISALSILLSCEKWGGTINNHSIEGTTLEISAHTFGYYPCFMIMRK